YFRWATPEKDTRIIGPGLAWWTRGQGTYEGDRGWRILWGFTGGGVERGRRYAVFFGRQLHRGPVSPKAQPRWEARRARIEARAVQRQERQAARRELVERRQAARTRKQQERRGVVQAQHTKARRVPQGAGGS